MTYMLWLFWSILALASFVIYSRRRTPNQRKLPPGPKPLPLLGNIRDFPPEGTPEHLHWLKHKDLYGPISSVTVMGMTLIIVHDKNMAHELLDQNASKTSGRPSMVMANKLCGYESIVLCQGYTPMFRRYRKFLHQELGTKVSASQFRSVQECEVGRQLIRSLERPESLLEHYKTTAAATVLQMAYGYTIEPHKSDALIELIEKMMTEFSLAASPMAWLVDIIPVLQHLPESFPGVSFKKTAREWRQSIQASAYIPYEFVQQQLSCFSNRPSYVSKLSQQLAQEKNGELSKEDEKAVIWSAASLYGAAADTTVITLSTFAFAMLEFPDVQRKAQAEIDRVVGSGRLPTFEDRDKLPYVDALVKETARWWPIVPMSFPHTTTEEFEYEGYRIPKDAFVLPAVWWFLHDPDVYINPESFDPDRFLPPRNEADPTTEVFGYGRRICPGRFFADSSLFINMAQTLAAFTIAKALDKNGEEIEVDVRPKPGILTYPTAFKVRVIPRSKEHAELVRQAGRKYPYEASDAPLLQHPDSFQVRY
ncbi:O-methylsterigmatocystin oxidoreductase [Colletotrichum abscissum]|uniref:O-methylsterigmatocystin oxidoreductase n=1 Tax=Colletotrichum abscissum TaxID=1671311 RepID=A0A9P9XCE3_9PEZI|nr:O-methylsterigmatocystin oxidoreductase [Colletotrichum abscissum]KAI3549231.1 O-methylsterigmatocystin oxidoreductase [Colletotrichum abscissum]KAK1507166.1 O-methylsterigmatocystin oxidoreductase [Colletotrichum abscissum]